MPLLKSPKADREKQEEKTSVKGTISVSLNKGNVDGLQRRGYAEVFSDEFKIMIFYEPIVSAFLSDKKKIDNLWALEYGKRKKKITRKELEKLTKTFEKKYGVELNG